MILLELSCLAIVATFVAVRARRDPHPQVFLRRLFLMGAAGWISEDTIIRAYDFYGYSRDWSLILDHVPLMIVVIWPVVIHSAWDLARHLFGRGHRKMPFIVASLVFTDAWLIEPVAVNAGLWHWNAPGLFFVPPIGVLGWAIFAGVVIWVLERAEARQADLRIELGLLALPAALSHVLLVAAWWGLFRWVDVELPPAAGVAVAWAVSVAATARVWRTQARRRVPLVELLLRVPAATFFFVLLALHARGQSWLVAYALAFAPPYLALLDLGGHRPRAGVHDPQVGVGA
jgi:hypothetical protein